MEVINTFKFMRSVAGKIIGGCKKEESEKSMKLTAQQQKEIKEGILKWETVITRITNTIVVSTTNSSSMENSMRRKRSSSGSSSKSSGSFNSGNTFTGTTGSGSNLGIPSGSPSISPSSSTTGRSLLSASGSPTSSPSGSKVSFTDISGGSSISPTQSGSVGDTKKNAITMTQVEAETSKEVMIFIINLEKKCPPKEEFKVFFEKLKYTMAAPSKSSPKNKRSFFSGIKSAAGKLSDAMTFMQSRIGTKSAKVNQSMETYQKEVMKTIKELETIHSKIVSQN